MKTGSWGCFVPSCRVFRHAQSSDLLKETSEPDHMEGEPLGVGQYKHTPLSLVYCDVCTLIQLDLSPKGKNERGGFSTRSEKCVLISELTQFHLPEQNSTSSLQTTLLGHKYHGIWDRKNVLFIEVSSFWAVLIRGFHTYSVNGFETTANYMCEWTTYSAERLKGSGIFLHPTRVQGAK